MGISASAILAFGVALEDEQNPWSHNEVDEEPSEADDDMDLGTYLAARAGMENPFREWEAAGDIPREEWYAQHPDFEGRVDRYFEATRKLEEQAPIEIVLHCSYEYPLYIVALRGKVLMASQGYAKEVTPEFHIVNYPEEQAAAAFCKENELPEFVNPKWLLVSEYG